MPPELRPALRDFLRGTYPGSRAIPIEGDASARDYLRLRLEDGSTRVVMDYGEPFEGETGDVVLTAVFRDASLPAARIFEVVPEAGCLVVEDLGDTTLEAALHAPASSPPRDVLYSSAVRLAARIAVEGTEALLRSKRSHGPALDAPRFRFEMDFFLEHYAAGLLGAGPVPERVREMLYRLADAAAETPRRVLCHRDYHSRNLLVQPDGTLAIVDLQDARWGPDTYDIASLLRDAYVDLTDNEVERWLEEYVRSIPDPADPESFRRRFDRVASQRMIKALGTFGYQIGRMGRHRYAGAVTRTLERLRRLLPISPHTADLVEEMNACGILDDPPG